jgi:hypothetical protein
VYLTFLLFFFSIKLFVDPTRSQAYNNCSVDERYVLQRVRGATMIHEPMHQYSGLRHEK